MQVDRNLRWYVPGTFREWDEGLVMGVLAPRPKRDAASRPNTEESWLDVGWRTNAAEESRWRLVFGRPLPPKVVQQDSLLGEEPEVVTIKSRSVELEDGTILPLAPADLPFVKFGLAKEDE